MMPVRAPLRSSSALVPTVVPCTMVRISVKSSTLLAMPSTKPLDWSPRVDGTLAVLTVPSVSSRMKTSVKVPPTSTPIDVSRPCHWAASRARRARVAVSSTAPSIPDNDPVVGFRTGRADEAKAQVAGHAGRITVEGAAVSATARRLQAQFSTAFDVDAYDFRRHGRHMLAIGLLDSGKHSARPARRRRHRAEETFRARRTGRRRPAFPAVRSRKSRRGRRDILPAPPESGRSAHCVNRTG